MLERELESTMRPWTDSVSWETRYWKTGLTPFALNRLSFPSQLPLAVPSYHDAAAHPPKDSQLPPRPAVFGPAPFPPLEYTLCFDLRDQHRYWSQFAVLPLQARSDSHCTGHGTSHAQQRARFPEPQGHRALDQRCASGGCEYGPTGTSR